MQRELQSGVQNKIYSNQDDYRKWLNKLNKYQKLITTIYLNK